MPFARYVMPARTATPRSVPGPSRSRAPPNWLAVSASSHPRAPNACLRITRASTVGLRRAATGDTGCARRTRQAALLLKMGVVLRGIASTLADAEDPCRRIAERPGRPAAAAATIPERGACPDAVLTRCSG